MNFIYGFPGDSLGYLVYIQNFLTQDLPSRGFWGGLFLNEVPQQVLLTFVLVAPSLILGPLAAFNLVVFLTFLGNFLSTFWVGRKFFSRPAALITALIVLTSLFVQWQATRSIEMAMLFWLPPLFLFLCRFWQRPGFGNVFWVALFSALTFLTSFHLGYFSLLAVFFTLILVLAHEALVLGRVDGLGFLKRCFLFIFFFVLLTLPATYPLLSYFEGSLKEESMARISQALNRNKLDDLIAYGARPWDFLMPSIYHPLWGKPVQGFYQFLHDHASYQFWSPSLPERVNFLTFTALILSLITVGLWLKEGRWRERSETFFFGFLALMMFLVSLPAVIHLKFFNLYSTSFFLFKIFPFFRVYSRAGVFVLLAVAFLAGYGWEVLLRRLRRSDVLAFKFGRISFPARKSVLLTALVSGLIVFENLNLPPLPLIDLSRIPQVYTWLREQKQRVGKDLILEYPKDNSLNDYGGGCPQNLDAKIVRDYNGIYEYYYQTFHQMNIFDYQKLPAPKRSLLPFLEKEETYQLLKNLGINYLVIHTREPLVGNNPWPYPQENPLDSCWRRRVMAKPKFVYDKFRLVADFDDGVIYRVE